jgi:transcriptional regulator with XRE-family HTH domain
MSDKNPGERRPGYVSGIAIRRARLAKGMTLRDVSAACRARQCPIDPSNLARAENNTRGQLGARKIPVLLEVLGLRIEDLIPDDEVAA